MSDILYRVRTVYETDTSGARGGLGSLSAAASVTGGVLSRLRGLAAGAFTGAMVGGIAAAGVGVAALTYGVTRLNAEVDSLRVGIAGMVNAAGVENAAGGLATWGESMSFAEQAMVQIRRDAAALPGEAEDFIEVFRAGLAPALNAGMRAADVAQFTNRFAAVGIAFRVDAPQIGRDLNLLLQGRAGAHVNMWNRLQSLIGKTAREFNALSAAARQSALDQAIRRYQPMIDAYADTWEAVTSTSVSYFKELLRFTSAPLFDSLKKELRTLNNWWGYNEASMQKLARGVGIVLVHAFEDARAAAVRMGRTVNAWSGTPMGQTLMGLPGRAAGAARGAAGAVAAHPRAGAGAAAVGAGLYAGFPGLGLLMGGLVEFAGHTRELNSVLGSLEGIGVQLLGTLQPLWGLFSGLQVQIGNLLATFLPPFMDGLMLATTGLQDFLAQVAPAIGQLLLALQPIIEIVGGVLGEFARFVGGYLREVFGVLGEQVATVIGALTRLVTWVNEKTGVRANAPGGWRENLRRLDSGVTALGVTFFQNALNRGRFANFRTNTFAQDQQAWRDAYRENFNRQMGIRERIYGALPTRAPGAPAEAPGRAGPAGPTALDRLQGAMDRLRVPLEQQTAAELGRARNLNARQPGHPGRPVVNVHIHQTVNTNEDPDRILLLTRRAVEQGIYAPLESPGVRVTR